MIQSRPATTSPLMSHLGLLKECCLGHVQLIFGMFGKPLPLGQQEGAEAAVHSILPGSAEWSQAFLQIAAVWLLREPWSVLLPGQSTLSTSSYQNTLARALPILGNISKSRIALVFSRLQHIAQDTKPGKIKMHGAAARLSSPATGVISGYMTAMMGSVTANRLCRHSAVARPGMPGRADQQSA